ncbi:DNA replication and repair protein RecN [Bacillus oleivorans]|uniref:DNA repair protein RecN n=1 Tax=Bacillus oleivorans TaxID=1448271 RepID=A0A285CKC4_9BACI|nr:DNA repair protein RecN [Bacillus oleivorans]SNX67980.1 DNA replication and repair protein RecN [Bacillus oleivorans]
MLAELTIRNFAIIDELTFSFKEGLTVLTGETGAGKSIIIDAIGLLAGGRGSAEFIRHDAEKTELGGLFFVDPKHPVCAKLTEYGCPVEEGNIILNRDIYKNGKSVCRVNGKLVTIALLREIAASLIDIHGQNEHQILLNEDEHLSLLDQYGGKEIGQALQAYQELFFDYEKIQKQLKQLSQNEQENAHRIDLLQFQLNEIQSANLAPNEDEELKLEKQKLIHFEQLYKQLQLTYDALQGDQKGMDWLGLAMSELEQVQTIDPQAKEWYDTVANAYYSLEDVVRSVRDQIHNFEFDEERLNEVESRLNEISQLKRKYGKNVSEILEYAAAIEEELDRLENRESHIEGLTKQLRSIELDLAIEAKNLQEIREKYSVQLTEDIHQQLKDLYMDKTKFKVEFKPSSQYSSHGQGAAVFLLSPNPGEPLKPLSKVASGGELSRIMLAIKSIFSKHQQITSIIFDEVDTGVSGRVAQSMGEKIYELSVNSQVLCISHLPQVAAMADSHFYIAKLIENDRTKTEVKILGTEDRIDEIGKMMSGTEITQATKQHAKELIVYGERYKKVFLQNKRKLIRV